MPLGINFGGATSGFANLANAGVFGPEIPPRLSGGINVPLLGAPILDVLQFGLDVFQTVRGGGSQPAVAAPAPPTSSSVVPIAANVTRQFTGDFAPQASQAAMRLPGGMGGAAAGVVAAGRIGVAFVLRKIKANTGLRITTKKIVSAIRQFGPSAVAVWAGVTMAELMIIWDRGSRRVKRRFTKRDRSRGRAYIRMLKRSQDELKSLGCGPRSRTTRRKVC